MIGAVLLALAQAAPLPQPILTPAQARLESCLQTAAVDATTALVEAAEWQEGTVGTERSYALQCQGQALVFLLRWDAAAQSFIAARDARLASSFDARARLGAMAGNALLASGDAEAALVALDQARGDAMTWGDAVMLGGIEVDRGRVLVALGRPVDAAAALLDARRNAPQNPEAWLLSATLARRQDDLARASGWIGTALALDPRNPDILLEAGLIDALLGNDERAREYWAAARQLAPGSQQAETAAQYLAQLDGAP
ncbi:tetratricopeptide repeat protein [Paraurantiacibacter namhicola]|uniref:Tetratricopeptide repeat protein n=1 Tax=Paraurantiacibacter namhicola TaxID=645517 RepID=A0A1C7D6D5_9SPHN|nr:tetratricopeptide repeat protein [Paraurantiacibacter namhicola]ANU06873.1 Tetratricopeptide repeat protein [Paraurantiacibacter namhicola]